MYKSQSSFAPVRFPRSKPITEHTFCDVRIFQVCKPLLRCKKRRGKNKNAKMFLIYGLHKAQIHGRCPNRVKTNDQRSQTNVCIANGCRTSASNLTSDNTMCLSVPGKVFGILQNEEKRCMDCTQSWL